MLCRRSLWSLYFIIWWWIVVFRFQYLLDRLTLSAGALFPMRLFSLTKLKDSERTSALYLYQCLCVSGISLCWRVGVLSVQLVISFLRINSDWLCLTPNQFDSILVRITLVFPSHSHFPVPFSCTFQFLYTCSEHISFYTHFITSCGTSFEIF